MVQNPYEINEAVAPETVQMDGVSEVKETVSPEVAVADRFTLVAATCPAEMGVKLIICEAWPIPKVWSTAGAAKYSLLPACSA